MIHGIQSINNPNVLSPLGVDRRRNTERVPFENRGPVPEDRVDISEEASRLSAAEDERKTGAAREGELTEEDERQVRQLKQRDQEVKAHERAHMSAGGGIVRGGANYSFTKGPDGRMYATGGEVSIDSSPERTPEATIRKAQQIRRAAMAPAEPSGQDVKVAAGAAQMETKARVELAKENTEKANGSDETKESGKNGPGEMNGAEGQGPGETNGARGNGPGETNGAERHGPGETNGARGSGPGGTNDGRGIAPNRINGMAGNGMAGNEPAAVNRFPGARADQTSGASGPMANGPNNMSGLPGMYGKDGDQNNFTAGTMGGRINMIA